jgi:hypothetical protein
MKQQFELSERLEREKKNLEDLDELEIGKLREEFEQRRSTQIAEHKKMVNFSLILIEELIYEWLLLKSTRILLLLTNILVIYWFNGTLQRQIHVQCNTIESNTILTVQYSTVQYSTVQYSTVQYSTVQYSAVQYSTVQCSTVQYSTVQYSTGLEIAGCQWPKAGHILEMTGKNKFELPSKRKNGR